MESNHGERCHHNARLTRKVVVVDHIEENLPVETDIWFACAFYRGVEFDAAGNWSIRQSIRTLVIIYSKETSSKGKRHKPSLFFAFYTILKLLWPLISQEKFHQITSITIKLLSLDNFFH